MLWISNQPKALKYDFLPRIICFGPTVRDTLLPSNGSITSSISPYSFPSYHQRFKHKQALQRSPVVISFYVEHEFWLEVENGLEVTAAYKATR